MKILIADDHPLTRCGVTHVLRAEFANASFGEAENGRETLNRISKDRWDLLLLDIDMPGRGGIDLIKEIRAIRPKLPILVLTMFSEDDYAVRAFKNGASGYLSKESVVEKLPEAVRKVLSGGRYVTPTLAEQMAQDLGAIGDKAPHKTLSDRELEVLRQLANGKSVTEIAKRLSLSVKTISTYRSRILLKMNMKSTPELMRYTIRQGIFD
jgi:two-component system invasion response regulator UvrY